MQQAPIRVMIVSNRFNIGGAERFAESLLRGLDRGRAEPSLTLFRDDIGYDLPRDVRVDVLGYGGPGDLPKAVARLRRLIRKRSPQVLLGVATSCNVVIGLALMTLKRRPAWIAAVDTNPNRRDLKFRMALLKAMYPMADAVVACSRGMQAALKANFPKVSNKIKCIYNPTDFNAVDRAARQKPDWAEPAALPVLVTVGRAHRIKRWDLLLDAVAIVLRTIPVRLICCGGGTLLAQFKTKARRMKIHEHVHFPGHCPNPFAILARADLFVMSSDAEGLPGALIEAQGLGLCAVATRCDFGPDEIIDHGETGLLVDAGRVDQMARAILALLSDDDLRHRMGLNAKTRVRARFDFHNCCRQWEDLIVRLGSIGLESRP